MDISQGGCIMTCSQFEKAAGRELSKKWKESIHVVGEGEGSKVPIVGTDFLPQCDTPPPTQATLVSWLKRQAEVQYGDRVVGQQAWVCWASDGQYYRATILSYSKHNGKHKVLVCCFVSGQAVYDATQVQYADRFVEELHLPVELLSFEEEQPIATACDAISDGELPDELQEVRNTYDSIHYDQYPSTHDNLPSTQLQHRVLGRSISLPGSFSGRKVGPGGGLSSSALIHQGSGVSVSSTYDDDGAPTQARRSRHERSFRGRVRHNGGIASLDGLPDTIPEDALRHPTPPPPLRTPASVRRRPARAPMSDEDVVPGVGELHDSPSPPLKRARGAPGLQHASSLPANFYAQPQPRGRAPTPTLPTHSMRPPSRPPADAAGLPVPPAGGLDETNVRSISMWMHGVALALEDQLAATLQVGGEDADDVWKAL